MDNKKILEPSKRSIIIIIVLLIISIALFVASNILSNPGKDEECITYNTLISLDKDEEGKYVKLEMVDLPYQFAVKTENDSKLNYYFAVDKDNYLYIIRLTNKTYQKLEEEYDKDPENFKYELKGYIYNTPSELKTLAIDAYNETRTEGKISIAEFEGYFGKTYLDEKITPNSDIASVLLVLGIFFSVFTVIIIVTYISSIIKTKKAIKKYGKEELEIALSNENNTVYPKAKIYLTEKYVMSTVVGLSVIPYEDIYWAYIFKRRYNGVTSKFILAYTKNKKCNTIASINDEEILKNILTKIYEKNNSALIGFTPENKNEYKKLPKIK